MCKAIKEATTIVEDVGREEIGTIAAIIITAAIKADREDHGAHLEIVSI